MANGRTGHPVDQLEPSGMQVDDLRDAADVGNLFQPTDRDTRGLAIAEEVEQQELPEHRRCARKPIENFCVERWREIVRGDFRHLFRFPEHVDSYLAIR